jgi:RimJ/RimL family protein N-acetyltransferase
LASSEGASALVTWGFGNAGYHKIVACTMAANHASRRVLEKAGLNYVRTISVNWAGAIPGSDEGEVWYEGDAPGMIDRSHGLS